MKTIFYTLLCADFRNTSTRDLMDASTREYFCSVTQPIIYYAKLNFYHGVPKC